MGKRRVRFTAAPWTVLVASVGSDAREVRLEFGSEGVVELDEDDQEPASVARSFAAHPAHPDITEERVAEAQAPKTTKESTR